MSASPDYRKGYNAGRKKGALDEARRQAAQTDDRQTLYERVYMQCLALIMEDNRTWKVGEKRVSSTDGYADLAARLANNAVRHIRNGRQTC